MDALLRSSPPIPPFDPARALALAAKTLDIEAQAVLGLKARQGDSFVHAVEAMLRCTGRVVVMGMGKSGHVGRKIAATLMSARGLGTAIVVDDAGRVLGIFTDGDLRRWLEKGRDLRGSTAGELMHPKPRTVRPDMLAVEAAGLMEEARITVVLVADADGRLVGAVNSNDLMRAKVI